MSQSAKSRAPRASSFSRPAGIEVAAKHHLPEVVDARRILANDHGGALLDRVLAAAFANAGNALVGFNGDDVEALIEQHGRTGIQVEADAGDLQRRRRGGLRQPERRAANPAAPPRLANCKKERRFMEVLLQPQGGGLAKPRPAAWVRKFTPFPVLKPRKGVIKTTACPATVPVHPRTLFRPFRAGGETGRGPRTQAVGLG